MTNHTLVVSDAADLAGYGAPPGSPGGPPYAGARYGGRPPGRPRESLLQRYLFSHRLMYLSAGLAVVLVIVLASWWFSSGRYEKVPTLRGLTLTAAKAVLKNQGLEYKRGPASYNPLPKGEVIKATPARGRKVAAGSAVTLVLSLGPHMRVVPDVSGQSEAAAKTFLQQHHLTPGEDKPAVSSSVPVGFVIGTIPRAYSRIPQYRKVRLVISEGPGLPSFIGMQVADAEAAAAAGGYHINAVPNAKGSEPANTIVAQSPSPNTPITAGEVVTVHYSPGPPGVPVPDVTGMSIKQAIDTLHQAGFRIAVNHQGPGDTVGSYSPTGTQPKGTLITLNTGIFSGL
jgi:serine/threonine-protein kinase